MVRPARLGAAFLAAAALAAATARAQPRAGQADSAGPEAISVTLYRGDSLPPQIAAYTQGQGLALITETRTVELPAGPVQLSLQGVADTLVPQTAHLEGLPGPIAESDFDYDLLNPAALVQKSIGRRVRLVRTNLKTGAVTEEAAVIRSGPQGVVLDVGGRVEALRCSGSPERLVFDGIPSGLSPRPTLSVRTVSPKAGRYIVKLSYLAAAFDWAADYVARIRPDGRTLDLTGWLTLANSSGTGFRGAATNLVAGRVSRTGEDQPVRPHTELVLPECWPHAPWWQLMPLIERTTVSGVVVTGSRRFADLAIPAPAAPPAPPPPPPPPPPMAKQSELGDYKLYTLPEPTTVAARQTKQVRFLEQAGVPFERVYSYEVVWTGMAVENQDGRARITLVLHNTPEQHLGQPLPSGRVAAMATGPNARLIFLGRDQLDDTPVGLPFEIELGRSTEVNATTRVVESHQERAERGAIRVAMTLEVTANNATHAPAVVLVRQPYLFNQHIGTEGQPHTLRNGEAEWRLTVPAAGHATVRYQMSYGG